MQELSYLNIQNLSSISPQGSPILIEQREFQVIGIENKTIGPACRGTQESFIFTRRPPPPPPRSNPLPYSRTSTNGHFSTTDGFFCLQGGHWGEVQPQASQALASPQTSFGVRSSRIHFSPTDVRGEEMNAWRTKPKGRLRGGYPSSRCEFVM